MWETQKDYEATLFKEALEYVKTMRGEAKDRLYRIAIGEFNWKLKKDTLSTKDYNKLRDKFVAATIAEYGIVEGVDKIDLTTEKEVIKAYEKVEVGNHFSKNAIKALEENFKEQTAQILNLTGEQKLDVNRMRYAGSKTYVYDNRFIISFENSPAAVEIRVL